ncbi:helix-turn-helix domain-containing protein [Caenimonas soli]|uniref:helix-turn-helix domain-containing protein n=1 Tax=Caenimonas soli TaxID=2735555 RepID=UPI001552D354|nr:AraC family transcriptional regulator [Caenimonas soli]NPC57674.1 helix-turn-helix transcriptional regulator [Caenimonas soli]
MNPEPRTPASPRSAAAIQGVLRHIDENLNQPLSLSELAGLTGLSMWRFATVFRQQVGVAPHRYICRLRLERAQALIREGVPAATAASEAGFYDQSHLSRHFKSVFGMTPGQYMTTAARQPHTPC